MSKEFVEKFISRCNGHKFTTQENMNIIYYHLLEIMNFYDTNLH